MLVSISNKWEVKKKFEQCFSIKGYLLMACDSDFLVLKRKVKPSNCVNTVKDYLGLIVSFSKFKKFLFAVPDSKNVLDFNN